MGLANILTSKISQIQKNKYCTIPLIPRTGKFIDIENKIKVTSCWGRELLFHRSFLLGTMERYKYPGWLHSIVNVFNATGLYTYEWITW